MEIIEFRNMMRRRTVFFTVSVENLLHALPSSPAKRNLQDQLIRSASSIGANYAESGGAESGKDFLHKLSIALKEAEETGFWLECAMAEFPDLKEIQVVWTECRELIKILQSSVTTTRKSLAGSGHDVKSVRKE